MNSFGLIFTSLLYLAILFGIAYWAEKRAEKGKSMVTNPYIYALSLAVYCTAWTFYGSVGRAVSNGIDFLAVYIGPTLALPLSWMILRKIIRICKVQRITSIADFISSRYGKNATLGVLVTIVCIFGLLPYIAIQLKAISSSFLILSNADIDSNSGFFAKDLTLYIAIVLSIFTIIFGTRKIDSTERHEGMVTAIAAESIIKLLAFLTVGIFVTYIAFDGFADIFRKAYQVPNLKKVFVIEQEGGFSTWFWHTLLSMLAIIFLPRQFQVAVVENVNEKHLNKAMWLFPVYMFLINIFVFPIAFGGELLFPHGEVNPDNYVLAIPLKFNHKLMALLTYIGGFSAATSMMIVETIALSTMISNNLIMPVLLKNPKFQKRFEGNLSNLVNNIRRTAIVLIILLAYIYYKTVAEYYSLVSIGLVSFTAVAQFAPAIIGGIFWKGGTRLGALVGIIVGSVIWFFTLVLPSMIGAGIFPVSIMKEGLFGIYLLKPFEFLGLKGMDDISHGLFWSISLNAICYVFFSVRSKITSIEHNQAVIFVDIFSHSKFIETSTIWRGKAYIPDIRSLLVNFFGERRTDRVLRSFATRHHLNLEARHADPRLVSFAEKLLAGVVGTASARIMVSSVSKEEKISMDEVMDILKASRELMVSNKELRKKSLELEKTSEELREAYEILKRTDTLKDDFLATVAHEIRTPLTSIRALSEIIYDNPQMDREEMENFLSTVIKESERLSRLINQVLDLEKYASGKQKLSLEMADIHLVIEDSIEALNHQIKDKGLDLSCNFDRNIPKLEIDRDKLVQVVVNLISNAVKFCQPDYGEIQIVTHLDDAKVSLIVKDNGAGISQEYQKLIFDKFYQAENQTIKKPKGSGLGLAISKRIIELHHGEISVESRKGFGATFTVVLPVK
ncbi:Na+/proline symporter [Pseudarcicella hirudinis]|uniref:histidine kinase n=1 Tax=Pseudarcicella hirudinis TaxID=1079859 RepID=A0A1I5XYP2_9BACT|nr:sensor histidine kinase [Pseudarcicella hirudinis]SFQ37101.1 Na+/proline symporter [Pseudarcicella hirudinis]